MAQNLRPLNLGLTTAQHGMAATLDNGNVDDKLDFERKRMMTDW